MRLLEEKVTPFSEVENVGVVIRQTSAGLHSGILYKLPEGGPRIVHLAFHHQLKDDCATEPYRWANMGLDSYNGPVLAVFASRVATSTNQIPYGFDYEGVCFDRATGNLMPPPVGKGLTCATFIIAFLHAFELHPVDRKSWPNRTEDEQRHAELVQLLEEHSADVYHVEAVRNDVDAVRIRPDEIVAAVSQSLENWPLQFVDVRVLADQILADLSN